MLNRNRDSQKIETYSKKQFLFKKGWGETCTFQNNLLSPGSMHLKNDSNFRVYDPKNMGTSCHLE